MKHFKWGFVLILLTLHSLCYGESPVSETRIGWMAQCPGYQETTTGKERSIGILLATILLPKAIDAGVDLAATALKKATEEKQFTSNGRVDNDFYVVTNDGDLAIQSKIRCLVIVKGQFTNAATNPKFKDWAGALPFAGLQTIDFRFETKIRALKGGKFFILDPAYLEFNKIEGKSIWTKNERDISISLSLQTPGAASPFASTNFEFKKLSAGTKFHFGDPSFIGKESLPLPYPAEIPDAITAKTKRITTIAPYLQAFSILEKKQNASKAQKGISEQPDLYAQKSVSDAADEFCSALVALNSTTPQQLQKEDSRCAYILKNKEKKLLKALSDASLDSPSVTWALNLCNLASIDSFEPSKSCKPEIMETQSYGYFVTKTTIVETRDGTAFAKFLAKTIGDSKSEISQFAKDSILPYDKAKAQNLQKQGDLGVEKAEADLAVLLADPDPKQNQNSLIINARLEVLKAKSIANEYYRKSGESVPYPEAN